MNVLHLFQQSVFRESVPQKENGIGLREVGSAEEFKGEENKENG